MTFLTCLENINSNASNTKMTLSQIDHWIWAEEVVVDIQHNATYCVILAQSQDSVNKTVGSTISEGFIPITPIFLRLCSLKIFCKAQTSL